jgi:hypothetical protein
MATLTALPEEISVGETAGGLRYRLPRRSTARLRVQAVKMALVGAGLLAVGIGLFVWAGLFLGFGLIGTGFFMLVASPFGLTTRSSTDVTPGRLVLTEWFGPVPVQRIRPHRLVRRFVVHRLREGDGAEPPPNGVIEVVCEGAQTLWFAAGYPYEWLTALAARLGQDCQVHWSEDSHTDSPPVKVVPFFLTHIRDEDTFDQPVQPIASQVILEGKPDGLTVLRVPPGHFFQGPAVLLLVLFPIGMLLGMKVGGQFLPWPLSVLMPLVVLAAAAVPLVWHARSRWTVLAASAEGLGVLWTGGPFKPCEKYFPRAQIAAIRVGAGSNGGGRNQDIRELYIYFTDGKQFGLFCGRAHDELRWLATVLRQTLQVPPVAHEMAAK